MEAKRRSSTIHTVEICNGLEVWRKSRNRKIDLHSVSSVITTTARLVAEGLVLTRIVYDVCIV